MEIGHIPVHAVETLYDDQRPLCARTMFGKKRIQIIEIAVLKAQHLGVRNFGAHDDAVVREVVDHDEVAARQQIAEQRRIGHPATDQRDGIFHAQKICDLAFEEVMHRPAAADKARRLRAHAER